MAVPMPPAGAPVRPAGTARRPWRWPSCPSFALVVGGVGVVLALAATLLERRWRRGAPVSAFVVLDRSGRGGGRRLVGLNPPWASTMVGKGAWIRSRRRATGGDALGPGSSGSGALRRRGCAAGSWGASRWPCTAPSDRRGPASGLAGWRFHAWATGPPDSSSASASSSCSTIAAPCRCACPSQACCSPRSPSVVALAGLTVIVAAFQDDVVGGSFGWRQPLRAAQRAGDRGRCDPRCAPRSAAVGTGCRRSRWPARFEQLLGQLADGDMPGSCGSAIACSWSPADRLGPTPRADRLREITDASGVRLEDGWGGHPVRHDRA